MSTKVIFLLSIALGGLIVVPIASAQSSDTPLTEFGHPDLQGVYTYRTITPLNRPRELEHLETLTPEQAVEWEEFELRRQNRDLIIDSVGGCLLYTSPSPRD